MRVTAVYATTLFVIASVLCALGPQVQGRVVGHLSTNLNNLGQGHLGTLLASASSCCLGSCACWRWRSCCGPAGI